MVWINVIVQGVLVGGLYAMFAAGLSLIFGIMRLVNIAHGDLIVLAAYLALVATDTLGIGPLAALLIVAPGMALIGYALQRLVLNRTLGDDLLPPFLVTFGLSVIIQNGLLELFTADSRKLQAGAIEVASLPLTGDIAIGVLPLLPFGLAVAVIGALQFYSTVPRSAARSARPPTIRRWPSSWASTTVTSSRSRWRCRSPSWRSRACCSRCAPISIPPSDRGG